MFIHDVVSGRTGNVLMRNAPNTKSNKTVVGNAQKRRSWLFSLAGMELDGADTRGGGARVENREAYW